MRMRKNIFIIIFFHLLIGCAAQITSSDKDYFENLAELRPKVTVPVDTPRKDSTNPTKVKPTVTPIYTVNEKVDAVLDSIDRYNLVRKFVDGYTIQVYSGQNREEAMDTKKRMTTELPELTANLQYQQPKFRVTVGRYYTKLEAHPDLARLRQNFTTAILVPEKIAIR
jgi:hypothetical protein